MWTTRCILEPIHGPYTKEWREKWLRRILEAQKTIHEIGPSSVRDLELIRQDELQEIRRIWLSEKYEFDDSLPRIYAEVTGKPFVFKSEDGVALGAIEWEVLKELSAGDELHLELIARLMGTEREFNTMGKRRGIYGFEHCFEVAGFANRAEAIQEAQDRRKILEGCTLEEADAPPPDLAAEGGAA